MKAAHDLGCGARRSEVCDCKAGLDRRITERAAKKLKRQRKQIARRTGLPYGDTLVEIKRG